MMRSIQSEASFPRVPAALSVLLLLAATCLGEAAQDTPRVVPFPEPPPGPVIRRVSHDAVRPLRPGDRLTITVLTEPDRKVTVFLPPAVRDLPCPADPATPASYRCSVTIPESAPAGKLRLRAEVIGHGGPSSTLSAALPVIVRLLPPTADADTVNVRLLPVYFASGSTKIAPDAREALRKDAELLASRAGFPILLEGHADSAEGGDRAALSLRRAEAVRDALAALGVPKDRMRLEGAGDSQPLLIPRDDAERAANRRVMVLVEPAKAR